MDVDMIRLIVECGLVMVAASFAYAFYERKAICDDLRDEIEGADDALRDARKRVGELKQDLELQLVCNKNHIEQFALLDERLTAQQNLNIALETELKKYRAKEKPMPCKGKKTGKKVKR